MKFSIKDFFTKCDQIHRKQWICSYLLKKSLMENFIFCAVLMQKVSSLPFCKYYLHCLKSVYIQSYSGPHFSTFRLNSISYSAGMRENEDQNKSEYKRFLRSASVVYFQTKYMVLLKWRSSDEDLHHQILIKQSWVLVFAEERDWCQKIVQHVFFFISTLFLLDHFPYHY